MGWGYAKAYGLSSWNDPGGLWATVRIVVVARVRGAGKRNWYNWATTKRTVRRRSPSDSAERLRYAFDRMASSQATRDVSRLKVGLPEGGPRDARSVTANKPQTAFDGRPVHLDCRALKTD